jgi:hypothetical protein
MKGIDMNGVGSTGWYFVSVTKHNILTVVSLDVGNTWIKTERFLDATLQIFQLGCVF